MAAKSRGNRLPKGPQKKALYKPKTKKAKKSKTVSKRGTAPLRAEQPTSSKPKRKTIAETIAETPIEEVARLTTNSTDMERLINMISDLRQGYKARLRLFEKKGLYSYAADKAEKEMGIDPRTPRQIVSDVTSEADSEQMGQAMARARNILLSEFAKYQQFFQQKTSTVAGIQEVNEAQARQIQGTLAPASMSQQELSQFWDLYDEFKSLADRNSPYRSVESQRAVYQVMFNNDRSQDAELFKQGVREAFMEYEPGSKLYTIYKAQYLLKKERERLEIEAAAEARGDVTTLSRGGRNNKSKRFFR